MSELKDICPPSEYRLLQQMEKQNDTMKLIANQLSLINDILRDISIRLASLDNQLYRE